MEIGIDPEMPTYSGGLGILAGDTVRSAADLGVPMVAVTLLHRKGYFRQCLGEDGTQTEQPVSWTVEDKLTEMESRTMVVLEGITVNLRAWRYDVVGATGHIVPIYFIDSDLPENGDEQRTLTNHLYGGDLKYRICQEFILGIGGLRMLRALGHADVRRFHMNEGHASFLTFVLLAESAKAAGREEIADEDFGNVRDRCIFTTHTPVPAGHDKFPIELAERVIGHHKAFKVKDLFLENGEVNMTYLALNLSRYVNGVAKKHGEVSRSMFENHEIDSITNGVHAATWTCPSFQELFDRHIPFWREDNFSLRHAMGIPSEEIWHAHLEAKRALIDYVNAETGLGMDPNILTIGFARRVTAYKRADLLFEDIKRLKKIARGAGAFQIVFAGKAHPKDEPGKDLIRSIYKAAAQMNPEIKVAFIENYNFTLGALITSGVDIWLNNPKPPLEASGTSGMKSAINGVPSLSILDGWWIEGCLEGQTGWAIGGEVDGVETADDRDADSASIYDKLENVIIPLYYGDRDGFIDVMRVAIAVNGSYFNTQRMMQEYVVRAYLD